MRHLIAVYGSSTLPADDPACLEVRRLGRLLAERGAAVMSGGYAGIMHAVGEGARAAGGEVIGVTVENFAMRPPSTALTRQLHAPDLFERLRTLITTATGYVVASGNIGTLTEFFLVWNLLAIDAQPPAPLVLLGDAWPGLIDYLRGSALVTNDRHLAMPTFARSAEEAIALLGV